MPHQSPRSIGVNSTALLSQLIVLPMQENEAHGLSVVVPLDLTAPVATLSTRKQSCHPSLQRRNHGSFEPSARELTPALHGRIEGMYGSMGQLPRVEKKRG